MIVISLGVIFTASRYKTRTEGGFVIFIGPIPIRSNE
jgi:uncharacterized membrane protein